jgi:hypothetical protein
MIVPLTKITSLYSGDTRKYEFQILENLKPAAYDLTAQTITFTITSPDNPDFVEVVKDIATESWILDNVNKKIKVVIDTGTYLMVVGYYIATIYWAEQEKTLVAFKIYVNPAIL